MKLSDYVAKFLEEQSIGHVFLVSGGAVVHLVDSVARRPKMKVICSQHEESAGASADGYARISRNLGCAMTTSGPGATNLTTSIANAYYDSIPCLFICGQVATFRLKKSKKLRQKGFQETDVVSLFKPITKYAVQIKNAESIRYELEKAVYLAKEGRSGPVVIDIPDDIQRVEIDLANLRSFKPKIQKKRTNIEGMVKKIFSLIESSKRPVVIFGAGIKNAGMEKEALFFVHHFNLPVLTTWGGVELIPYTDSLNMNCLGVCGPRWGNFAVQNADLVIAIGTRLSQLITGGKQNLFAPHAKKVMIDVDSEELTKFTADIFTLDIGLNCTYPDFFSACKKLYQKREKDLFGSWREKILRWKKRYPICPKDYYDKTPEINPYVFIKELSRQSREGDIITVDTGATLAWTMQSWEAKKNQRIISAWSHTPMGYSLPAAIGATLTAKKDVICITGDGGLMMCLEELATVVRYKLPVKIFISSNHCHGIQKQTLDTWLESRYTAVDEVSGLFFPSFIKVGRAFGLATVDIERHRHIKEKIREVLDRKGPVLCNVEIYPDQKIVPMLKFGSSLEDLNPKIPEEEMKEIMSISKI
jgi:acetolactate synthase-1/2/3 large subunit